MGTAGRSAPLRRTGSLLGLLGLELAAVAGLHWLGRLEGLRIGWDKPVDWLLSSPVQDVLGALLRTVGLVMAYWLLASTLLYLLASLTRLPAAVRAVGWATLPMVRRVADHAVAVTLATSMVGGGTLGVAGPALAADRGRRLQRQARALLRAGPPATVPPASVEALALAEALRALPMHQRQAIVLHHLVDLPLEEVAATLGARTGTVKSWLARGRRALADRLGEPEEVPS
jgi:hypothetical protein